ncbi:hypothetical protein SDC9_153744 [bioreactor metagenome]|uniref:Uncharacterized protein n=1 Tax=bioreactor metagenome TaxID=1076179 RepID=A0A645EWR4_9ZZZZ
MFILPLLRFLLERVKCVDPRLGFGGPCLWLAAHPVQFLPQQVTGFIGLSILRRHPFFPFFQMIGVVAFIGEDIPFIDLQYLVANPVEEVTVVRHHQQADIVAGEMFFEPLHHFEVEVVGRLVHD